MAFKSFETNQRKCFFGGYNFILFQLSLLFQSIYQTVMGNAFIASLIQRFRESGIIAAVNRFLHSSADPIRAQVLDLLP